MGIVRLRALQRHLGSAELVVLSSSQPVVTELDDEALVTDGTKAKAVLSTLTRNLRRTLRSEEREKLRHLIYDGFLQKPDLLPVYGASGLSTEEQRALCTRTLNVLQGPDAPLRAMDMMLNQPELYYELCHAMHCVDLSLAIKSGVQFTLWGGSVMTLGTEKHHRKYRADIANMSLCGCFAMTELEHGSNVGCIETSATFDADKDEFVIQTPHDGATKWWIGNAATDARAGTVFAQLQIGTEAHGVHAFIVPLRDDAGNLLPGVEIHDCGEKVGLNGVDNGAIQFHDVRIPRDNLLDRFGHVAATGEYSSQFPSPNKRFAVTMGALTGGRVGLTVGSTAVMQLATTIAIRYATRRRQFGPVPANGASMSGTRPVEVMIMEHPPHQRKLIPILATCFAHQFAADHLVERYAAMKALPEESDEAALGRAEVHALSSGLKPVVTWATQSALDTCRESCGGHGYAAVNRLGELRNDHDIWKTFEGDNTVLLQQLAGELVKQFGKRVQEQGSVAFYLKRALLEPDVFSAPAPARRADFRSREFQLAAFRAREARLLSASALRLQGHLKKMPQFQAWSKCMNLLIKLATAHVATVILECFTAKLMACAHEPTAARLTTLCDVFVMSQMAANPTGFLIDRQMSRLLDNELGLCCNELSHEAECLVDAFDIPDHILRSPIGLNADEHLGPYMASVGFTSKRF